MKQKLSAVFFFGLLLVASHAHAAFNDQALIKKSSYTATNETLAKISSTTIGGGIFDGIVVSSPTPGGSIILYDSIGAASSQIGLVSLTNGPVYVPFEVRLSSGLTYTTAGNTYGISIIYRILRPTAN